MQHTHTCAHTRANTGSHSPVLGAAVVSRCRWSLGASSSRYQSYSPLRSLNPLNWERLWFTERERAKQSKVRERTDSCAKAKKESKNKRMKASEGSKDQDLCRPALIRQREAACSTVDLMKAEPLSSPPLSTSSSLATSQTQPSTTSSFLCCIW